MKFFMLMVSMFLLTGFCSEMTEKDFNDFEKKYLVSRERFSSQEEFHKNVEVFFEKNKNLRETCNKRKSFILENPSVKINDLDYDIESYCLTIIISLRDEKSLSNKKIINWYLNQDIDFSKISFRGSSPLASLILLGRRYELIDQIIGAIKRKGVEDFKEDEFYRSLLNYASCLKKIEIEEDELLIGEK